jgi:TRAP-type mannitol/chloroaromatic compound transport system substrate-binding protein
MSNGAINIEVFPSEQLVPSSEIFKALGDGVIELADTWCGYCAGQVPEIEMYDGGMHFTLETLEERWSWYYHEGAEDALNEMLAPYNVRWLGPKFMNHAILVSRVPLTSVDDFNGLKIRTSGCNAIFFEALGAKTVTVPTGEIYTALQQGLVDAATWSGEDMAAAMGLHEVAPYLIEPCYKLFADGCWMMNLDTYNELPAHLQEIVRIGAQYHGLQCLSLTTYGDAVGREKFKEVCYLTSPDDLAKFQAAALVVMHTIAGKNENAAKGFEMLSDFLNERGYTWVK